MKADKIGDIIIQSLVDRQFPIYLKSFFGVGFSEADIFGISKSGFMYEYEIKCSKSDFKADFKKHHKHYRLENNDVINIYSIWEKGYITDKTETHIVAPNRFYYACKDGLILPEEIPDYAGLVYISELLTEIKPAKLIHHNKVDLRILTRIATILSERTQYGSAYRTYKYKNN